MHPLLLSILQIILAVIMVGSAGFLVYGLYTHWKHYRYNRETDKFLDKITEYRNDFQ